MAARAAFLVGRNWKDGLERNAAGHYIRRWNRGINAVGYRSRPCQNDWTQGALTGLLEALPSMSFVVCEGPERGG